MPDPHPANATGAAADPAAVPPSAEAPAQAAGPSSAAADPAASAAVPPGADLDRPASADAETTDLTRLAAAAETDSAPSAAIPAGDKAGFRLAAFGAVLVIVLFAGYGLGRLNNGTASASAPTTTGAMPGMAGAGTTGAGTGGTGTGMAGMPGMTVNENQPHVHTADGTATQGGGPATPMGAAVGGLSLSSGGLTLVPAQTTFTAGTPQKLSFRIAGPGGAPVTTYAIVHDKLLHLIVVRRDLTGFQHLHPTMAADGTWSIDLTLAQPGVYRMVADFTAIVAGQQVATTLGSDLTVPGDYLPSALPAPAHAVEADGFAVGYEGKPDQKSTQPILVGVAGPDRQAAALEPYLGAYGHLVVLREGDLAYVHVHPEPQLADGKVKFWLSVPSAGTYRMFFDFQLAGKVHTAAWTARVE